MNVLSIEDKWAALQRIQQGDMHDNDVDLIANDWGLESIVASLFRRLNLTHIPMQAAFSRLSGGEQTKVLFARTMLTQTDFILLDEPTNHLDLRSIKAIEAILATYQGAMLVISHDFHFLDNINITRRVALT